MKKMCLFLVFLSVIMISVANAGVTEMNNIEELRSKKTQVKKSPVQHPINLKTEEDYKKFFEERLKYAEKISFDEGEDLSSVSSMNIQHSKEYLQQLEEDEKKGTLEKIYDAAIARLSSDKYDNNDIIQNQKTVFYKEVSQNAQALMGTTNIPTVEVVLPLGQTVLAPAAEHIPYLFLDVTVAPTGLIKINETVIVVANAQKLKNGLSKMLPMYSISRDGKKHKIHYELEGVSINGDPVEHNMVKMGNNMLIKAKQKYSLAPGVYTYEFKYIVDRHLWEYDDFNEFYWNVSGSKWNLLIDKVGVMVNFFGNQPTISQNVLIGYNRETSPNRAKIIRYSPNSLFLMATTPVLIGEDIHVLIDMPKDNFIAPDFNKKFSWFLEDYGDNLFAILGFLAIFISYAVSWYYIKRGKTQSSIILLKLSSILRMILKNKYDAKSFGSFLLEMYNKKIIDIEKDKEDIVLVKKTDNLRNLNRSEKKAINAIFTNGDSNFTVNKYNVLKLKRAYKICEKETLKKYRLMRFQNSIAYLLFSVVMLLIAQFAIALNNSNMLQTLIIEISADVLFAFYIYALNISYKNKYIKYTMMFFAIVFILGTMLFLSAYILGLASLLIFAMIYTIFEFSLMFSHKNGLLRMQIKEAAKYQQYLESRVNDMTNDKEFLLNQPNIFAVDLEDVYKNTLKNVNKMSLVKEILQQMS